MGKRWEKFKEIVDGAVKGMTMAAGVPAQDEPEQLEPMRSWKMEMLNERQREDLEEVVNLPGYEVLRDLYECALEGFITNLVETSPEDKKKVRELHRLVHAAYLFNKSVERQVAVYIKMAEAENEELRAIKAALAQPTGDPLQNIRVLNRVLNPIHQDDNPPPSEKARLRATKSILPTPMDEMLSGE